MTSSPEVFPLIRYGSGWSEPQNPNPRRRYDAYRVICEDPRCPALSGPALPLSGHSHIYIDEGLVSALRLSEDS